MSQRSATRVLEVPGARIVYDVVEVKGSPAPPLLLFGSPMDASGFAALAARFPDRTILTYDPRGTGRSGTADGELSPELHAQDLEALAVRFGKGPVDMFASSGGAVNALAFARHAGDLVSVLVVHEPPLARILPDHKAALAGIDAILGAYQEAGRGPAMARFMAFAGWQGEFPPDPGDLFAGDLPVPGLAEEDDGTRDDPLFARNLRTCTSFQPDFDGLRDGPASIVVGVGAASTGTMAARAAAATAGLLGTLPVTFPGGHGGFLADDPGPGAGDPVAFAEVLRQVLDGR